MVAKFIAHGSDRADAVRRLTRALDDVVRCWACVNNGRFLRELVNHPQFTAAAAMTTTRLDEWAAGKAQSRCSLRPEPPDADLAHCRRPARRRSGRTVRMGRSGNNGSTACQRGARLT